MKIERKSLLDSTLDALRGEIVSGRLLPGERITEVKLAADLGIGRSTVRSALLELEKDDLVQRARYSAWTVAQLTHKVVWEVYTLRAAFEGLAVRILAKNLNEDARAELLDVYGRLDGAENRGNESERVHADLDFHRAIVRLSGHDSLARQYAVLGQKIEWIYRSSEHQSPGRIVLPDWHKPVLEAILARDPDQAEKAIRTILEAALADDLADFANLTKKRA